jgi:hypothetical protein
MVPGGTAGAGFTKMDINKLIDAYKDEAAPAEATPAPAATP